MKIKVNTKIITDFKPCKRGLDAWMLHYSEFNGDIAEFLLLEKISYLDKLWLTLRLVPSEVRLIFALDCSLAAHRLAAPTICNIPTGTYYTYSGISYTYSGIAYAYSEFDSTYIYNSFTPCLDVILPRNLDEQNFQIEALIYLIRNERV